MGKTRKDKQQNDNYPRNSYSRRNQQEFRANWKKKDWYSTEEEEEEVENIDVYRQDAD
jgi:hypothetical protein